MGRSIQCLLIVLLIGARGSASQERSPLQELRRAQSHAVRLHDANKRFEEVFGPAPALASSPYLSLAILTGAALIVDQPFIASSDSVVARQLKENALIHEAKGYASWWMFVILVVLALSTMIANSGKLQGSVGKLAHLAEGISVAAAYFFLLARALSSTAPMPLAATPSHFLIASFVPAFELGRWVLLFTGSVTVAAIMFVRFGFDVLIWLTPIPFIDVCFGVAKTIVSIVILLVYLVSPFAAAVVSIAFLVPTLLLLPWATRLFGFACRIAVRPLLAYIFPTFKGRLQDQTLKTTMSGIDPALFCRGNVVRSRGFKKRQSIALVQVAGQTTVQPIRRPKRARALAGADERIVIGKALAWIEVRVLSPDGRALDQIALPYSLMSEYSSLCSLLSAQDIGALGAMKAIRNAGRAANDGIRAAARATQDRLTRTL